MGAYNLVCNFIKVYATDKIIKLLIFLCSTKSSQFLECMDDKYSQTELGPDHILHAECRPSFSLLSVVAWYYRFTT
jgi:hypothetical protein